ncbi:MAG: aminopeptidase [Elusimicrobia bacterium]|nr:aminopeptidase [Elusimicrobiota bacterium]
MTAIIWRSCLTALLLLAGCSPAYVFQAWRGHARLMSRRQPIERLLKDPATPPELRARLRLAQEVRAFAFERVGIPVSGNYSGYVDVPGPAVTFVVSASRRAAFEAKTWWFPFVGRVPYKGYFAREAAERERARLEAGGWDAALAGVPAYSTLRWFEDPVLSTMARLPPGELAELLLHELTHTAVFLRGQADFNEAFATFCGEAAAQDFLASRFGADSPELAGYRGSLSAEAERSAALEALYRELDALYRGAASDEEKLERRGPIFERHRATLGRAALNNATVLAYRRYRRDLDGFRQAHERLGRSWPKTLGLMRSLGRRAPREALKRWLEGA